MKSSVSELNQGHPVFPTSELNELSRNQGSMVAWKHLLATAGAQVLADVSGEFAIGFSDERGRIFLAVDRFAINSLCYRVDGQTISFASRADELAAPLEEIDPQAIYDYFYFHVIPSPRTIFKNVFRLPAGHYAIFDQGVLTICHYWTPEFNPIEKPSFDGLRSEFRQLLAKAVEEQLDGTKPGCFLSGGTDSSTVAGMISEVSGRQAATYSIGFEAEGYDEMEYARIAAKRFGTEHHEYYVTPEDLVRSIPKVAQYYDQPFGNSSALPAYYCAAMAKADGVSRILAGDGGDELFGGNSRYAKQQLFGHYQSVPALLRSGILEPILFNTPLGSLPLARKGASYIEQAKVPMPDRNQLYNMLHRLGTGNIFTASFLESIDLNSPLKQQREVWSAALANTDTNRELAYDWRYTLAECDLPKVVGTTKLAGLSVGFPLLDRNLLEFSMRLPNNYKLNGQKLRWFFKEALRGFLPDEILIKKKQGFGLPFGVWALKNKALNELARGSVLGLVERGIMRADFVDALFKRHLAEHPGYYGEMIWLAMMLEQWLCGRTIAPRHK